MNIGPRNNSDIYQKSKTRNIGSLGLFLVILVFSVLFSILSPVFLTVTNIMNLLIQSSILAVLALGTTFVILTKGIDLSVGGVMAVSSAVGLGMIVNEGAPVYVGVLTSLLIGLLFGLLNGVMVTRFAIPPLIVSLASMAIARGIIQIYTNGANISPVPDSIKYLASGQLFDFPVLLLIVGMLAVIAHLTLCRTVYGRAVYASGGSELAARLAGIRTKRVITGTYVISGVLAAIAGILLAARLESAGPNAGMGIELTVIAAVVIGGTSLFGGQGNIVGTLLGVLLISLISNAVNLLDVPPAWDQLVKGIVIMVAALLDVYRRKYYKTGYAIIK
ncbi:ABC transporter permease [Paenibacillus abyssi]|uniref:ABC transporter permease n=1 Tax=Paenibacillus abyssi TaxID=1340531 RepID=A0A917CZE1_9BACL|nr:ABC transporter permease [Paenibacillus abyssi]GGG01735.1 ABC transporter permease [Paenibacillus abyssi]